MRNTPHWKEKEIQIKVKHMQINGEHASKTPGGIAHVSHVFSEWSKPLFGGNASALHSHLHLLGSPEKREKDSNQFIVISSSYLLNKAQHDPKTICIYRLYLFSQQKLFWYNCPPSGPVHLSFFAVRSRWFYNKNIFYIVINISRQTLTELKQLRFTWLSTLEKPC